LTAGDAHGADRAHDPRPASLQPAGSSDRRTAPSSPVQPTGDGHDARPTSHRSTDDDDDDDDGCGVSLPSSDCDSVPPTVLHTDPSVTAPHAVDDDSDAAEHSDGHPSTQPRRRPADSPLPHSDDRRSDTTSSAAEHVARHHTRPASIADSGPAWHDTLAPPTRDGMAEKRARAGSASGRDIRAAAVKGMGVTRIDREEKRPAESRLTTPGWWNHMSIPTLRISLDAL